MKGGLGLGLRAEKLQGLGRNFTAQGLDLGLRTSDSAPNTTNGPSEAPAMQILQSAPVFAICTWALAGVRARAP